ncbi:hypothetical protein [Streptacidiphilus sp. EB129]|uniref:hypothetical protein n=1 Tax=Streptacidiphilus sp. EB129 TaxID=3156262 RepID=UPI0035121C4F
MRVSRKLTARKKLALGSAVAVAGAGLAAAVAGSAGATASLPALGTVPVVTSSAHVPQPLDAYGVSDADMQLIMQARHTAELGCMVRLGFSGNLPMVYNDPISTTTIAIQSQRLRYLDPKTATKDGYHLPGDTADGSPAPAAKPAAVSAATEALETAAYEGTTGSANGHAVPKGGCKYWANSVLTHGSPYSPSTAIDSRWVYSVAQNSAMTDPRMTKVAGAWSACMKQRGFSYTAPWDAPGDNLRQFDGSFHTSPSSAEVSTATADAVCRTQNNVLGTWTAVTSAWEKSLVQQKLTGLEHGKANADVMLANAKAVLAGKY